MNFSAFETVTFWNVDANLIYRKLKSHFGGTVLAIGARIVIRRAVARWRDFIRATPDGETRCDRPEKPRPSCFPLAASGAKTLIDAAGESPRDLLVAPAARLLRGHFVLKVHVNLHTDQ